MRFLPDTSCLVAAVCAWHEHHAATVRELARRERRREAMVMAAPVALEAYVVLTRLPPPYRLRPQDALAVMEGSWSGLEVVGITGPDTWQLLRALPANGIAGGRSYDAHVAACARKGKVDVILTWNLRDFEAVADGIDVAAPRSE